MDRGQSTGDRASAAGTKVSSRQKVLFRNRCDHLLATVIGCSSQIWKTVRVHQPTLRDWAAGALRHWSNHFERALGEHTIADGRLNVPLTRRLRLETVREPVRGDIHRFAGLHQNWNSARLEPLMRWRNQCGEHNQSYIDR